MNLMKQAVIARRPSMGLTVVLALHVLFVYALITGVTDTVPGTQEYQTDAFMLDKQEPTIFDVAPSEPTDPTHIIHVNPGVSLPPVVLDDQLTVEAPPDTGGDAGQGTAEMESMLTGARVDPRNPLSQPPYPPSQIRQGNEGALTLALLIGIDGRVKDVKVSKSSGFPILDEAAVNEARRRWRLLPAMRGDTPVVNWMAMKVVFRLDQR